MTTMTMRRTTKTSVERVCLGEDHSLGHRHGRVDSDDATTVSSTRRAVVRAFVDETSRRRRARRRDGATTKGATTNERATIRVETSDADETRDDADAKVFDRARRATRENRGVSLADEYRRRKLNYNVHRITSSGGCWLVSSSSVLAIALVITHTPLRGWTKMRDSTVRDSSLLVRGQNNSRESGRFSLSSRAIPIIFKTI